MLEPLESPEQHEQEALNPEQTPEAQVIDEDPILRLLEFEFNVLGLPGIQRHIWGE